MMGFGLLFQKGLDVVAKNEPQSFGGLTASELAANQKDLAAPTKVFGAGFSGF